MSTSNNPHRRPILSINHEAMQRVSTLGVIDPATGVRHYWCPDAATDWLTGLMADPEFTPSRYCNRCEAYDHELKIHPWQKRLPQKGRRSIQKMDPVNLPWQPGRPPEEAELREYHKSRPGRPMADDACHMCLISFLDEQPTPDPTPEEASTLKAGWRTARNEVRRLNHAKANEANPPELDAYIDRLLEGAWKRLRAAARACRNAGIEPARPRTLRAGEDPPQFLDG